LTVKDDFRGRIDDIDKFYNTRLEKMDILIDDTKTFAKTSVSKKEAELQLNIESSLGKMQDLVGNSLGDLVAEREQAERKNKE
jgi:hypothetical protein